MHAAVLLLLILTQLPMRYATAHWARSVADWELFLSRIPFAEHKAWSQRMQVRTRSLQTDMPMHADALHASPILRSLLIHEHTLWSPRPQTDVSPGGSPTTKCTALILTASTRQATASHVTSHRPAIALKFCAMCMCRPWLWTGHLAGSCCVPSPWSKAPAQKRPTLLLSHRAPAPASHPCSSHPSASLLLLPAHLSQLVGRHRACQHQRWQVQTRGDLRCSYRKAWG